MVSTRLGWRSSDLVPLADRLRYMQMLRVAFAVAVVLFGMLNTVPLDIGLDRLGEATAWYVLVSLACQMIWRRMGRRSLPLFGAMVIGDGMFLSWVTFVTGGTGSPLRFLMLLHLIAVALLGSYRTGLKVAFWDSLLLLAVYYARQNPAPTTDFGDTANFRQVLVFIVVFWVVTIATSSFSAVNERELRRRRYDLEALARLATELEGATDAIGGAEILLDSVLDTFGFQRALVVGGPSDDFSVLAKRVGGPTSPKPSVKISGPLVDAARRARDTILARGCEATADEWLTTLLPDAHNLVVAPLWAEGCCIGVLVVEHGMRSGSRIERRVVTAVERFAGHAALALRNAWLLDEVREMAATDSLTALANRRAFERRLQQELLRASRRGEDVSLLMLDLDHFKQINDNFGHNAGDDALRRVADVLTRECRVFDLAARYGGEEFAIIMSACDQHQAISAAHRLRRAVSRIDTALQLTVSVGVATAPRDGTDVPSLMKAADQALYASKRAGRNRVTAASSLRQGAGTVAGVTSLA